MAGFFYNAGVQGIGSGSWGCTSSGGYNREPRPREVHRLADQQGQFVLFVVLALLVIGIAYQIRRTRPTLYENTAGISLVSSFVASLFLGKIAPIDVSDASGMNLMDVFSRKWVDTILETVGGKELRRKLKEEPVEGGEALGRVHPYWTQRWGFAPGTSI